MYLVIFYLDNWYSLWVFKVVLVNNPLLPIAIIIISILLVKSCKFMFPSQVIWFQQVTKKKNEKGIQHWKWMMAWMDFMCNWLVWWEIQNKMLQDTVHDNLKARQFFHTLKLILIVRILVHAEHDRIIRTTPYVAHLTFTCHQTTGVG